MWHFKCCDGAFERVLERERQAGCQEERETADLFAGLADPTRLRLLDALSRAELCVCDLATVVDRSMPATSHQLKILRGLGLVRFRIDGKLAYYSLADEWARPVVADALRRAGADR